MREIFYNVSRPHYNTKRAGGLIYDKLQKKILVVKGIKKWSLPKGQMENDELPHQTAMREIFEETSMCVNLNDNCFVKKLDDCYYYVVPCRGCQYFTPKPVDTKEIKDARWCTYEQLKRLNCNRDLYFIVSNWNKFLGKI
jgi:ADP-ribose pyrophosphatase YjhB (NUDIX family)